MPIPAFDGILNVLPPHAGNVTQPGDLSPYHCTLTELCDRFATTPARKTILDGFLNFRGELRSLGIQGFQWLDGSFLEDIETQEGRYPKDIDVVTFVAQPTSLADIQAAFGPRPELLHRPSVKNSFSVDHFQIPLCSSPERVVDSTRYWYGLFSHRRDRVWKGMLRVELMDKAEDDQARQVLESKHD
jgi:hypothetical protein